MAGSFLKTISVLILVLTLSGCIGVGYYAQSLGGHADLLAARQSIEKLADDPSQSDELRARMRFAGELRRFAVDELALPDNRSYRTYVETGRDYVTWAVFAAPEFSLSPVTSCFPIYGCVPYRGYFSQSAAERYADTLRKSGMDVHVAGIPAYSTLGLTADPLLDTMFRYGPDYLAGTVFHELAHQRLYVKDDSAFNEAYATAIERKGVIKWLEARGDQDAIRRYQRGEQRQKDFLALLAETRANLATLYDSDLGEEAMRAAKAAEINGLRARYEDLKAARWGGDDLYDQWFDAPVNNARLATVSVYNALVPAFMALYDRCNGNAERFHAAAAKVGALAKDDRREALETAKRC